MRHHLTAATLLIWYVKSDDGAESTRYLETIEPEAAYLVRKMGQWSVFQTEIHFYQWGADHRHHAERIVEAVSQEL